MHVSAHQCIHGCLGVSLSIQTHAYICDETINPKRFSMKHIYLSTLSIVMAAGVTAQGILPMAPHKDAKAHRASAMAPQQAGDREIIYTNDCNIENCADWVFDNGSDIAGSPWDGIDINFFCTTEGPTGPYNQWAGGTGDGTAAGAMNSTTSDNGYLIIDSDEFGQESNYSAAWVENAWFQNATAIDCSGHPYVTISFETRYRCWDNGASDDSEKCLVEISRDGVNWPDVSTSDEASGTVDYGDGAVQSRWEVFPGYATSDQTDNPTFVELDITEAAGDQAMVYVRFRWVGTWGYSWEVDDISIYDTPAYDIRVDNYVSYTDFETTGIYENGAWAESQLIGLDLAAKVYNTGYEASTGTHMNISVNGNDVGNSDSIYLDYQAVDTLRYLGWTPGDGPGSYEITYTLMADSADENEANNVAVQGFEVTTLQYGRDDGTMTGLFPGDGADDFVACNPYDIWGDATIYAIDVAIASGSEEGTPVIAHLYDGADAAFLDTDPYGGLLVSSAELDLAASYSNDGSEAVGDIVWYTLVLEEPYDVAAGDFIGAGFEHYGGSNVQIWESKYTQDQTSFVYGPFGSGGAYAWYYTNEVPMVRLNLDPNATNTVSVESVTSQNFRLFQSFPNPASDIARIQYSLEQNADVAFEVRDLAGKLVYSEDRGTQPAGYHSLTLNVSDWAAGMYTYTLTVDGARDTKRLSVQ
jgi:hypothetical protein